MSPSRFLLAALLLFPMGGAPLHAQRRRLTEAPAEQNQSQGVLGVQLLNEGGRLKVVSVFPGSAAEAAGIRPGDIILSAGGATVEDPIAIQRLMGLARARGVKVAFVLERNGSAITVQVGGAGSQGVVGGTSPMRPHLPGAVAAPAPGLGFNVLRYAALDARTGEVVFWGDYDPSYPTGPLPYERLLAEALKSPSPSFSLEPTPAGRSAGQELDRRIAQDTERFSRDNAYVQSYTQRLLQVLTVDLAQRPDGRRFAKCCGEALGLTPAEAIDVLQPERGQKARGINGYMTLVAKVLSHIGNPNSGEAVLKMVAGDTWAAMDLLGVGTEARAIRAEFQAGRLAQDVASARMQGLIWGSFLVNGGLSQSVVDSEKNRRGPAGFLTWAQERFTAVLADTVGVQMFKGMVLGEEAIARLYPGLPAMQLQPVCMDGLDPKSTLAQIFMKADVALKSVISVPDLVDRVPGHRGQAEFLNSYLVQRGKSNANGGARARTWLQPGAIEMNVDPGRALVRFGEARMAIRSRVMEDRGNYGSDLQRGLDEYGAGLSARYEGYAKCEPELHRLREAAKVLALARWARAQGLDLHPQAGTSEGVLGMVPRGFVQAVYLTEGTRVFLQPGAVGGVDFSAQVGDGWVQAKPDSGVVSSALGQLQASAALAGQAADKAASGDLEGARELAQRSADAMTGRLQGGAPPAVPLPTAVEALPFAQASTGLLNRVQGATAKLKKAAPDSPEAQEARTELQGLRTHAQRLVDSPQSAPQVAALLKPGAPSGITASPGVALPANEGERMKPEDRQRILAETTSLRSELCRIRTQLKKLDANIQSDQALRAGWEQEVDGAYNRAWDRLKDVIDLAAGDVAGNWNDAVGKGERTAAERAKIAKAGQVLKTLQGARSFQDFAEWASKEEVDADYVREGLSQIYDLVGGDEVLRKMLRRTLGTPIAKGAKDYYDAGKALVDTAFDLTAEGFAWAGMRQLNRNTDSFRAAVKALAARQAKVLAAIHERELKLGLPAGATQDGC